MDIILASKSPRRRELLTMMGFTFRVIVTDSPEPPPSRSLSPEANLEIITAAKGEGVSLANPDCAVIAADTVVVLGGEYLGKPLDEKDAQRMLKRLSGNVHEVFTGVMVCCRERDFKQFCCVRSEVRFRELSDAEISDYIATGEPMDKAGAYGIQGFGAALVERVEGSFYNVMGLPVGELRAMLFNLLKK